MYDKRTKIRLIVQELRKGTYYADAIHNSGIKAHETVRMWRTRPRPFSRFWHQRLDFLLTRAWKMAEEKRVDAVEKAFLKKLLSGEASAACYVFYLCNRASDRWKHVQTVANVASVTVHNEKESEHTEHLEEAKVIGEMGDKDLDQLVERLYQKRQTPIPSAAV